MIKPPYPSISTTNTTSEQVNSSSIHYSESPRTLNSTFDAPTAEEFIKFQNTLRSTSCRKTSLDRSVSPKLDRRPFKGAPVVISKDTKPRFPRSPMSASISLIPLPVTVLPVDATDTEAVLQFINATDTLVVDVRPFNAYSTLRLAEAINICLPSTLLKRASFDLAHVVNASTISQTLKDTLLSKGMHFKILVYDQASAAQKISLQLYHTVLKFLEGDSFLVAYLDGGFEAVDESLKETMPTLPVKSPVYPRSTLPRSDQFSDSSDGMENIPFLTGFTLPTATNSDVKLLDSIKKTLPRIDTNVKYTHHFKFPENFAEKKDKLPEWLRFIAESYGKENCNQEIVNHLNERFNRLEASEQVRLSLAINNTDGIAQRSSCTSLHDSSGYGTPSELCPCCDDITYTIPKGVEYGYKNRYKNVWPYEHSRVRLKHSPSCRTTTHDDYFNANYIHFDELSDNRYIATQNPLEATNEDFWNAVWSNGVQAIVCLDNSKSLHTTKYYEEDSQYQNLSIHIELAEEHTGFTFRKISIKKHEEVRTLYHFAYTDWPDFGTPDDLNTVVNMMKLKDEVLSQARIENDQIRSWEVLVHCSAGCGRTGCFITLDMVASLFENLSDKALDPWGSEDLIYKSVQFQRQQRISMVQNLGQFIFCYESVLSYILDDMV